MRTETLKGLTEISPAEYSVFGRTFRGEVLFHAPAVTFLGFTWSLMLGAVNGELYKIAPSLKLSFIGDANRAAMITLTYCKDELGKPSQQQTGLFCWDATDGNVILQTVEGASSIDINLFITSRTVQSYTRL